MFATVRLLLVVIVLAVASPVGATIDLTTVGANATVQSVIFTQGSVSPYGTFTHLPFSRIQATSMEQGFNTDFRPLEPNAVGTSASNHSLPFRSLVPRLISTGSGSNTYYEFQVDINETSLAGGSYLSIDQLKIYSRSTPDIATLAALTAEGPPLYDLDLAGNETVLADGNLQPGSGVPEFTVQIPTSYFSTAPDTSYLYLFMRAGDVGVVGARDYGASGGFEEVLALMSGGTSGVETTSALSGPSVRVLRGTTDGIRFRCMVPSAGVALIRVFDVHGRVATKVRRDLNAAGAFEISLSSAHGPSLASGVYFYQFDWNGITRGTGKLTLLR
jgi:hypothetical protein